MNYEDLDQAALEVQVVRLAADRSILFRLAGTNGWLTPEEQQHLTTTERHLDECFHALRGQRAVLDARRFNIAPPARLKRPRT